jgi:DNA-binding GntR family transcriptional regulator
MTGIGDVDEPAARSSRDEMVFDRLCNWIADGTLLPGQHLVPERLAEQLGVSRTPVTNALKRLKQAGLLDWVINSGAFVKRWDKAELAQLFELRGVLEGLAARHAAGRLSDDALYALDTMFADFAVLSPDEAQAPAIVAEYLARDRDFHGAIIKAAANPVLQRTIAQVHVTTSTFAAGLIRTIPVGVAEHSAIVAALRAGDAEAAEREMRRHLQRSVERLKQEAELEAKGRQRPASLITSM